MPNSNLYSAPQESSREVLIERTITFRNSTFGGLKTFIRTHKRRTGETLTNAAAVDLLVRRALMREIHPDAVRQMQQLTKPVSVSVLMGIGDGFEDAPTDASEAPTSRPKTGLSRTTLTAKHYALPRPSIIAVEVRKAATAQGAAKA